MVLQERIELSTSPLPRDRGGICPCPESHQNQWLNDVCGVLPTRNNVV